MIQKYIVLALTIFTAFSQMTCPAGQFPYNSVCTNDNCTDVYTKRFGTTSTTTGIGDIPSKFNTTVELDANGNLLVLIAFTDLKDDSATKVDNPGSCIVPVHSRYSLNFAAKTASFVPVITSSFIDATGYRLWVYTIPSNTFNANLLSTTSNSTHFIYVGYYGVDFNVNDITQVTLLYTFQVAVTKGTSAAIVTSFSQLLTQQTAVCNSANQCITNTGSSVFFCTTSACAVPAATIQLALNQFYWLYVNITSPGFSAYRLTNPTISLASGSSLARVYTPDAANVSISAGHTIIAQSVDFAYAPVQITVATLLAAPVRRILQSSTGTSSTVSIPMTAASNTIACILNSAGACATCSEQCAVNKGSASTNCPPCSSGNLIMIAMLLLGLIM